MFHRVPIVFRFPYFLNACRFSREIHTILRKFSGKETRRIYLFDFRFGKYIISLYLCTITYSGNEKESY